jgi:hypothetical protein
MNLQEILKYRERCIHCNRLLTMSIEQYPKLSVNETDKGLKIKSGHKDGVYLNFGFDGKYERSERNYKIYAGPILIKKSCRWHPLRNDTSTIKLKSRTMGMTTLSAAASMYLGTTLSNMKDTVCHYSFSLFGDSQGNYDCKLLNEFIYWHDEEEFWHIDNIFDRNMSRLHHGKYDDTIDEAVKRALKLPVLSLKSCSNIKQLTEKLKLYTLFS